MARFDFVQSRTLAEIAQSQLRFVAAGVEGAAGKGLEGVGHRAADGGEFGLTLDMQTR